MQVRDRRVLKNGAIAGYVKQRDGTWRWRIIGNKTKGGDFNPPFKELCSTNFCKTLEKYSKIEKNKLLVNNKKSKSAKIKAKLSTLHNTGVFNTYYSKMLRRYEEADKKEGNRKFKNLDDIIKELSEHKKKKYKNVKKDSKRNGRGQYLQNIISKIKENKEKIKKNTIIKNSVEKYKKNRPGQINENKEKNKIRNEINNSQFLSHLGNKNKELEKRVNFMYELKKKGLPIPMSESQFHYARVFINNNNDSIYTIEQWTDYLETKVREIYIFYNNLYNLISINNNKEKLKKLTVEKILPMTILSINNLEEKQREILNKIDSKIVDNKKLVHHGKVIFNITQLNTALTYLQNENKNLSKNKENTSGLENKIDELTKYISDFTENFDIDLFLQIPDKQIAEFFNSRIKNNN